MSTIHSPITFIVVNYVEKTYDLFKLATRKSSFIFDNKLYKQIDGVMVGSPLGSTLANVFIIRKHLAYKNAFQFKAVVYRRHADDIFVLIKSKEHLKHICQLHKLETEYKIYF